jgi:hypothetical protein
MDTIREQYLISNKTNAEASYGSVFDFNHLGFDLNGNSSSYNLSGNDYVAWCWKGGGDAVPNTNGDITSQVSANDKGFSIVKHANSGNTSDTVGHGLTVDGVATTPELYITKKYDTTTSWHIYTTVIDGSMDNLRFTNAAKLDVTLGLPTSTIFYNQSGTSDSKNYISYCFASVDGYSKIGTYEGTNSAVTVSDVGFKPSFVMIKNIDDSADWVMLDNRRNTIDDRLNNWLRADSNAIETGAVSTAYITVNDNGFIVANTTSLGTNSNGDTYIYMAFK